MMDHFLNEWGQPTRGYILVDTSALFKLTPAVDPKYLACCPKDRGEPLRYLETIRFLAHAGFSCILPTMVVYEAANMFFSNECVRMTDYFGQKSKPFRLELQDFIQKSMAASDIHIIPQGDKDTSLPATFMRLLSLIHKSDQSKEHKTLEFRYVAQEIPRRGFGDIAMRELVRDMPTTDLPIFYLCEDIMALRRIMKIREDLDIHQLTVLNFLGAINEQNLFEMMGIHTQTFDDVLEDIHQQSCAISVEKFGYFTESPSVTNQANQDAFTDALDGIRPDCFVPVPRFPKVCAGKCPRLQSIFTPGAP